jgi:hypothetical protein
VDSKTIIVGDGFRTNPLSFKPGGSEVKTVSKTAKGTGTVELVYSKIKNPEAYIRRITSDPSILKVYVDGVLTWTR